jgi:hypothetical protein
VQRQFHERRRKVDTGVHPDRKTGSRSIIARESNTSPIEQLGRTGTTEELHIFYHQEKAFHSKRGARKTLLFVACPFEKRNVLQGVGPLANVTTDHADKGLCLRKIAQQCLENV